MSLRYLYRKIPQSNRRCSYYRCPRKSIRRNIDLDKNGRIYHHGCLMDALDEQHECLECFSSFDGTETSFETQQIADGDYMTERLRPLCPHCGSSNLKGLSQVGVIET
jgi:Zn finger protein HypA/HybF involved in hydrogenase expression